MRYVRRAIYQWRINSAAYEAQLCLRDARVAHENYHAQMRLLAVLHGRQRALKRPRATATSSTRCGEVPVLLCVPGRRP
jgi:hypothetical protein